MALDLSKLSALELPSKEIEVKILGDTQKIRVYAYDDGVSLDIADIADAHPESQERRVRTMLLIECAKLSSNDAEKLVRYAKDATVEIINAIFDLRKEFVDARNREQEAAQKNLTGEKSQDMPA
jgi:hypothetical protein